jgi:hypothetical protein
MSCNGAVRCCNCSGAKTMQLCDLYRTCCALQEAITNFQKHGSIVSVAPAPPRGGMQRTEAMLKQQRVHIEWLSAYLLPSELEAVARASVFAGPFTAGGAAAVGCCGREQHQHLQRQQQTCNGLDTSSRDQQEHPHTPTGVERVLRGLVLMSVLCEGQAATSGERRFSMHPLIRELGRELRGGRLRGVCGAEGESVEAMMVRWMVGAQEGPGGRLVLHKPTGRKPNLAVCQGVMAEEAANFREAARLVDTGGCISGCVELLADMLRVGAAMRELGHTAQARQLEAVVVGVHTGVLGPEHPHTLGAMANLAISLQDMGDLAGARELAEKVLGVCTRVLGPEHPHTLSAMANLAISLHGMGDLAGARELREAVLGVRTGVLGPEHPDTLDAMQNLAISLKGMGDLARARELREKVLGVRTRVLGPEHPDTLSAMGNLAVSLGDMGDLAGARDLEEKVLSVRTRVLGPEHPQTLDAIANLAITQRQITQRPTGQCCGCAIC